MTDEIQEEMSWIMVRQHVPGTSPSDHFITERAVGKDSYGRSIDKVAYELAQIEVNSIGRIGYGNTRLAQQIFDTSGNFGAFLINVYYGSIAVMEGTVHNEKDLIYTIARNGDLFEAKFLTSDICRSGAEGDTTRHHSFGLKSIDDGVLSYVERVRTEFDNSRISSITRMPKPRATKIEDIARSHKIQIPNREEIEKILSENKQ